MKKILTLLLIINSVSSFSSIPERTLENYSIVNISSEASTRIDFNINYPGIGGKEDCLVFIANTQDVTKEQVQRFVSEIIILEGDGILFEDPDRDKHVLSALPLRSINGHKRMVYRLKTKHTYLTGLRIKTLNPYEKLSGLTKKIFKKQADKMMFVFVRECKL